MRFVSVLLPAFLALLSVDAMAQVNSTYFTNLRAVPNPATTGETVYARIFVSPCGLTGSGESITGTQTSIQGSTVTLTLQMSDGFICFATPPPPQDEDFVVGNLAPGTYTLVVQPVADTAGLSYAPLTTTFTVTGSASSIPLLSARELVLLALALAAMAGFALRRVR